MSSYRDALLRIADGSARQVLAAYRSYVDGLLTHDEAVAYISSAIAAANGRARMLADLRLAAEVMAALGTEQPVAGVPMPSDRERLAKAAATMLATAAKSEVPEKIARRLAESEPVQAASEATTEAMVRSGKTNGWVRDLSPDACQMCRWWWRERSPCLRPVRARSLAPGFCPRPVRRSGPRRRPMPPASARPGGAIWVQTGSAGKREPQWPPNGCPQTCGPGFGKRLAVQAAGPPGVAGAKD